MTIEIKPENYYSGLWRADLCPPNAEGDFLATLWKDTKDDRWHLQYRFRYYNDDAVFDSKDKKCWYELISKDGAPEAEQEMKAVMDALLEKGGETGMVRNVLWIPCYADGNAFAKIMMNPERPWSHAKHLTKEQYDEYARTGKMPS